MNPPVHSKAAFETTIEALRASAEKTIALLKERRGALIAAAAKGEWEVAAK